MAENLDNLISELKKLNKTVDLLTTTINKTDDFKLPIINFSDKFTKAAEECEKTWGNVCDKIESRSQELVNKIEVIFGTVANLELNNSNKYIIISPLSILCKKTLDMYKTLIINFKS